MLIEKVPIDSVSPDPANVRRHPERNVEQIKSSLRRFGQQKPIVVDGRNVVRAGNGTLAAARALGWERIDIVRSKLSSTELSAFAIVDNRSAELAEWDKEMLAAVLSDPDIGEVGFDSAEIDKLLNNPPTIDEPEDGSSPEERWLVVVTCQDEADQLAFLEEMGRAKRECKAISG